MTRLLCVLFACAGASSARAQNVDTTRTDSSAERLGLWARTSRSSGLIITTGKTYNRVEGLPVYVGPTFHDSIGPAEINGSIFGIIRSADTFRWDSQNLGHRVGAEARVGRGRGYALGLSSYDVMTPVETWQLPDPDAALAAFFGHRDFRDYFNRHGAKATATFNMSPHSSLAADWSDERWSSARDRHVFSVFGNGSSWRANPVVDAGRFHLGVLRANVDTRNDPDNPSTGWLIAAEYEHGAGQFTDVGPTSPEARVAAAGPRLAYGRALVDLRRYNRLSPTTWFNARLVLGGWLHGDELPLERRFSVGGIGTVPGVDFRDNDPGTVDVSQCSSGAPPSGNPAQCERVALAQLEYRNELPFFDFLNARPIRLRGIGFTVRPTAVAFVDAGRGWLVGQPTGTLVYSKSSFPRFGTFRTDVGLGLDLGIFGVYVAKSVSSPKEPANAFLRVHRLF